MSRTDGTWAPEAGDRVRVSETGESGVVKKANNDLRGRRSYQVLIDMKVRVRSDLDEPIRFQRVMRTYTAAELEPLT